MEPDISDGDMGTEKVEGLDSPVNITVTSYRKRRHDPEGLSIKAILDGLVRRGLLSDDSTDQIGWVKFQSIISKEEKTIIEIEEVT